MTEQRAIKLQKLKSSQQMLKLGIHAVNTHLAQSIVPGTLFTVPSHAHNTQQQHNKADPPRNQI
jgi:hypothetical protein